MSSDDSDRTDPLNDDGDPCGPSAVLEGGLDAIIGHLPCVVFRRVLTSEGPAAELHIRANPDFARRFGVAEEARLSTTSLFIEKHLEPSFRGRIGEVFRTMARAEPPQSAELEGGATDMAGDARWLRGNIRSRRLADGRTVVDGIIHDITGQKRAEEKAADADRHLAAIVRNIPCMVARRSGRADGSFGYDVVHAHATLRDLYGIDFDAMLDDPQVFLGLVHPDDRPRLYKAVERSITDLEPFTIDYRIETEKGGTRWLMADVVAWRDASGTAITDGITIDITEQKLTERRLADVETRFAAICDNLPGAIFRSHVDGDGMPRAVFMSPGIVDVTGLDAATYLKNSDALHGLVHDDDLADYWEVWHRSYRAREAYQHQYRITTPKGDVRWVLSGGAFVEEGDSGAVFVDGFMFDVSAERQMRSALARRNHDLLALCRISEIILDNPDLDAGLQEIVTEISQSTGFERTGISFYDEAKQTMATRAYHDLTGNAPSSLKSVPIARTMSWQVVRTGQMVVEEKVSRRTEPRFTTLQKLGLHGYVGLPIRVGGRVVGALSLGSFRSIAVDPWLNELMASWADYIATFIASKGLTGMPAPGTSKQREEAFAAAIAPRITDRQRDVLDLLVKGKLNREIAAELNLREPTVKIHVRAILSAFNVKNRTQAAMLARQMGADTTTERRRRSRRRGPPPKGPPSREPRPKDD